MRILIPQPLPHLAELAPRLAEEHEVVGARGVNEEELAAAVVPVDALVANGIDVSERVLAAGERLRAVGTAQVGYDRIDVRAATERGIPVLCGAGVSPGTVAEFTVGLMLGLCRQIGRSDRALRNERNWSARARFADPARLLGSELTGRTLGVVGVGQIGRELARMCRVGFSMTVLGYDPFVAAEQMAAIGVRKFDGVRELVAEADFVVLHVPLRDDTRHLVDRELLAAMKPSAFLLNCARGPVVDEAALIEALTQGVIAGAALDVYEREPLSPDSPLYDLDNVIITPHIAGVTFEGNNRRAHAFAQRLLTTLRGERSEGLANPDVWPRYLERCARLDAQAA